MLQKLHHMIDSQLTAEQARSDLADSKIRVVWFTNHENKQSVVHSHPYYELIIPFTGSVVVYSYNGNMITLHLGELIIFPGNLFHSGRYNVSDDISERLIVQVDAEVWEKAMANTGLGDPAWQHEVITLDADSVSRWRIRDLFERMAQSAYLKEEYRDTAQMCVLVELMLFIQQSVDDRHTQAPGATSALVGRAVAYLKDHYTDPELTTSTLAACTYASREHLSRAFKEYTSESIHNYLTNLRMQHCRRAIADGKSVLDACTESGFSNYSSFLKTFRKLYGLTPADYKKQLKTSGRDPIPDAPEAPKPAAPLT